MKKLYSRYRKLTFAQGAVAAVSLTSVFALAAPVTGLFQFTPGTTISSAQMNQNFLILKTAIESTSSQTFRGTWDANTNTPDLSVIAPASNAGDYYVVSVAGTYAPHTYAVGDWAIWNGTTWDRVPSSSAITTVFGRTGSIAAMEGDYTLDKMADVNTTSPTATMGSLLRFDGTQWRASQLPSCAAGEVLRSDGTNFICATDNAGQFTGSATTMAELNFVSGVSSPIQTQLNNKEPMIAVSSPTKYWRGDKTFQTLDTSAVTENTNLYFTNTRVLNATLSGLAPVDSVINASDTIVQAFNKTQGQLSTRVGVGGGAVTTGTLQVNGTATITVPTPLSPSEAANKGYVDGVINANGVWTKSGSDISYTLGSVQLSNGTASFPPIRAASQPTGIFFPGGNQLAFSLTGNEVMRIANGKVGIGPGGLVPNNDLDIYSNAGNAVASLTAASSNAPDMGMLVLQRSRGTPGAPDVVQNADAIGTLNFSAYNSSVFAPVATIVAVATGTYSPASNPGNLLFKTTNSGMTFPQERMRIDYAGNVGVGTTSPAYKLDVNGDINASGSVRAAGVALTSDKRLKKNIVTISHALEKLLGLRGVEFDWRNNDTHDTGVIAQEVEAKFPNLVLTDKNGYKSVKYANMAGVLIESTKELNTKITKLESENKMLKGYLCERDPSAPFCE